MGIVRRAVSAFGVMLITLSIVCGVSPPAEASTPSAPGAFVSIAPERVLDTRGGSTLSALGTTTLTVTGRSGVPTDGVAAVAINVTVTSPSSVGYITVYPSGSGRPTASNLNFSRGQTVANMVIVKIGGNGKINLFNGSKGRVDLIADVAGYYLSGTPTSPGAFTSVSPTRLLDTRTGPPVAALKQTNLQVTGRGAIPRTGVAAVVLNVTVTESTGVGYITVFPGGTGRPGTSNLNFSARQTVPNLVVVKVGSTGTVSLFNGSHGPADLIVDIAGWYSSGNSDSPGSFIALTPARLLDSRTSSPLSPGGQSSVPVTNRAGVPSSGVSAVVLNLTVTGATGSGYLTAYPNGGCRPNVSNLNFGKGQTIPNLAVVKVGQDGKINLFNGSGNNVQVIADIEGYYRSDQALPRLFCDGTSRVGSDVAAGTYRTTVDTPSCYWARLRGFSGGTDDIIANDFTDAHDLVTISPSDIGFKSSDCGTWTNDLSRITSSETAPFADGAWLVGTDIASGTWRAPGGPDCYWERLSGFSGLFDDIIANDFGPTQPVVAIAPDDAGFKTASCGTWTKIS